MIRHSRRHQVMPVANGERSVGETVSSYGAHISKKVVQSMEKMEHSHVQVRGLKLHVAQIGTGLIIISDPLIPCSIFPAIMGQSSYTGPKVVLFLHGFPEIWYSWRHQMVAVANAGFRAVAFDFRGYGLSEQPSEPEKANFKDLVDDIVTLLDSLSIDKVFVVGKDFGAVPAFMVSVIHPERVLGVITLGIPFLIPGPVGIQFDLLPKGFYILRWAEPGRAEADFGRFDVKTVVKRIYILFCRSELQVAGDDEEIMDLVDQSTPLPPWFTEEDLDAYATLYQNSGFTTALQVPYRCSRMDYGVTDPKVTAPSLLIMGEKDYFMKFPGMEEYMRKGIVKQFMPNLDISFMPEGNHFVQEQFPEQVNELIISFLNKNCST
ncbi:hypothetical protein V6N12_036181 [Hibiscus sabdariffa]|uniref:AB hydrolase-1 domain-containing protein n=1 Tax=Hibiscus sabdariffa TaxID=183260 RepID=A0ABR2EQB9_9ROSI